MGKKTATISLRATQGTRRVVEERAREDGTSLAAAAEALILRGAAQGCTPAEVGRAVEGLARAICEEVREEVRALASRIDEAVGRVDSRGEDLDAAVRELRLAEKNIGHAAQASLATLAYTAWFSKTNLAGAVSAMGAGAIPSSAYVAKSLKLPEMYGWFWNVGGALRRDPRPPNFARAFAQTESLLKGHAIEDVTGMDAEQWGRITGRGDAEAIADLAPPREGRPGKKRARRAQEGPHEGR